MKLIYKFIKSTINFSLFILKLIYHKTLLKNPIKYTSQETITLLANGPSLKDILPLLKTKSEFQNTDFIVLNFFAFEDVFFEIKPKHYCFADPMFFQETSRIENVKKLFTILQEKVNWDINIYIPQYYKKEFKQFSNLSNPFLHIININAIPYSGYEKFRFFFYKRGLSAPPFGTVANLAIFVGINMGYKNIFLYGVDHTFLDSICVNKKNQLCNKDKHFYDNEDIQLKPIIKAGTMNEIWKVGDYLHSISIMFQSHEILAQYAQYRKARIINKTANSMIDSYARS